MALDIPGNRVMIEVACNDPDNGLFAGRAEQIQVGCEFIELEPRRRAPRFVEVGTGFRMAGKVWHSTGSKYGIGNWCWNGYWMEIPEAVRFFAWLHQRQLFDLSCGETRLFNRWRIERPFDQDDLAFLDRLLGKPSMHSFAA